MKCPNCGGQMGWEDAVCPYCGTPNAEAAQHRSDMARFQREYQDTQADVMERTSFVRRHGSWLAVVAVLLAALAGGIVINTYAWDIGYSIRGADLEKNAEADRAVLESFLEQGDYGKFVGYYSANDLSFDYDGPYQALYTAASAYTDILQYAGGIGDPDEWAFKPDHLSDTCGYIAEDLNRIYTLEERYSYDIDRYLPAGERVYLDDIRDRTAKVAQAYFGLPAQDIEDIPDMSTRKLARAIEEGIAS